MTAHPADMIQDCRVMLRYALRESKDIPDSLLQSIAKLDHQLGQMELEPLSDVPLRILVNQTKSDVSKPDELIGANALGAEPPVQPLNVDPAEPVPAPVAGQTNAFTNGDTLELLLGVYAGLSKVVVPATAQTLMVTEATGPRWWPLRTLPFMVQFASVTALISAMMFTIATLQKSYNESSAQPAKAETKVDKAASGTPPFAHP